MYSNYVTNLVLRQVFPSGWEIGNDRLDKENVTSNENSNYTYQDVRDDRVYTFFDLLNGSSKTFRIRLTASYIGRFYFPGTLSEAMYEPGVNAFMPGKWVEVVK
jgi:alpha-2-macroglobulin